MLTFRCSRCTQPLQVPLNQAGKSVRCPRCQQTLWIPAPANQQATLTIPPDPAPALKLAAVPPKSPSARPQVGTSETAEQDLSAKTKKDLPRPDPNACTLTNPPPVPPAVQQPQANVMRCGKCTQPLQITEALRGRMVRCPRCQQPVQIPPAQPSPPQPPPLPNIHPGVLSTEKNQPASGKEVRITPADRKLGIAIGPRTPLSAQIHPARYQVLEEVGRGGMGVVYKARDLTLNRIVALKMVISGAQADETELTRFRREVVAVAALQHPNIVQIYEIGEHNNLPFCALEFCEGGNLAQYIAGNVLSPERAAEWIEILARTVHEVHRQGIIHRDLKPANVLLTRTSVPKITDFGLAKRLDDSLRTGTGAAVGTPAYMAPEQARGTTDEVDAYSDVYGLGAILYEMLAGRAPFAGPLQIVLFNVVHMDPPAPSTLNPGVPRDLETICLKCMHKEPTKRYTSALELAEDVQRFRQGNPILARPISRCEKAWRWCRRHPGVASLAGLVALLLVAVVVGSGVAAFYFNRKAEEARRAQASAEQAQQEAEAARNQETTQRKRAEQAVRESKRQRARRMAGNGWRALTNDPVGSLPWFAESLRLAQGDPIQEQQARIRLGMLLRQYPLQNLWFDVRNHAFSKDGKMLAITSNDGTARVWDVTTGTAITPVLKHGPALGYPRPDIPEVPPPTVLSAHFRDDGKQLVTAGMDGMARVWNLPGGQQTQVLKHDNSVWLAMFTPGGDEIVTGSVRQAGKAYRNDFQKWNVRTGSKQGSPWEVADLVRADERTGQVLGGQKEISIWNLFTGKPVCSPLKHDDPVVSRRLSTNGQYLATVTTRQEKPTPSFQIRVWNTTTGAIVGKVIQPDRNTTCYDVSSDGKWVVTGGRRDAQVWDLATGKKQPRALPHVTTGGSAYGIASPPGAVQAVGGLDAQVYGVAFGPESQRVVTVCQAIPSGGGLAEGQRSMSLGGVLALAPGTNPGNSDIRLRSSGRRALARRGEEAMSFPVLYSEAGSSEKTNVAPVASQVAVFEGTKHAAAVWDVRTGELLTPSLEHSGPIEEVSFCANSRFLMTHTPSENRGIFRIWKVGKGRFLARPLPGCGREELIFSPDGRQLFVHSPQPRKRQLWDLDTGKQLKLPSRWPIREVTITRMESDLRDEKRERVRLSRYGLPKPVTETITVNRPVPREKKEFAHEGALPRSSEPTPFQSSTLLGKLSQLAVSRDGQLVVTGDKDSGEVVVRSIGTGKPVSAVFKHTSQVTAAALSDDNRLLATLSGSSILRVWEVATGDPLTPPMKHTRRIGMIRFGPRGRRLVTVDDTRPLNAGGMFFPGGKPVTVPAQVWVWDLITDDRPLGELTVRAQVISGQRVDATGSNLEALNPEDLRNGWAALRFYNPPFDEKTVDVSVRLAWHKRKASECEQSKLWVPAYLHLSHLIEDKPRDGDLLARRGNAYAEAGQWQAALDDHVQACQLLPSKARLWYRRAVLQLILRDVKAYRTLRAEMHQQFGPESKATDADTILWACILIPEGEASSEVRWQSHLKEARKRATEEPTSMGYQITLGAALYRAGKYAEAAKLLEGLKGVKLDKKSPAVPLALDLQRTQARLFLALALHRAERKKEATEYGFQVLRDVERLTSLNPSKPPQPSPGWEERFALRVLNNEMGIRLKLVSPAPTAPALPPPAPLPAPGKSA